jgi:hypothetical protein
VAQFWRANPDKSSIAPKEARKDLIFQMAALVWLGLIGIIFVGTFLFGWLTRTPRPVAA